MITFKQYLGEDKFLGEEPPAEVKILLEKHCGLFLKEAKGGFLYRGVKIDTGIPGSTEAYDGTNMDFIKKAVRTDRKPKDMSRKRTTIVDDWFNEKFGIRARTNCVFAAGAGLHRNELSHYGTPCIIFPIGDIKYVWSEHVEDMYNVMDEYEEEKITKWLGGAGYQTTDLQHACRGRNEIMVQCSSYYAFPMEYATLLRESLTTGKT